MNSSQQAICWDDARVAIAIRYGLKRFHVNFTGPFARLGSHPKCEIRVPFGQNSVLAYLHVVKGGLAVVTLPPEGSHRCQTQFVATGDSLSLTSPITISVESLEFKKTQNNLNGFKHNQTNSPDSLLLVRGSVKGGMTDASFLVAPGISILGRSESCQLKLRHRTIAPYQCAIIRCDGSSPCMRIVDLLSYHSTTIGVQIARGQKLDVEDVLTLGKMVFTAKRLGNGYALLPPSPKRELTPPPAIDLNELQIVDSQQELEIVSELGISQIVSDQPVEARPPVEASPPGEIQLQLAELARSMATLVSRIEKIELSLGCIPHQIEEFVSKAASCKVNENTNVASDRGSPVEVLAARPVKDIYSSGNIEQHHPIAKEILPRPVYVASHISGTVEAAMESLYASNYDESPAEACVLGQLIELRTRTDNRRKAKLIVAAVAGLVVTVFVIATVWNRVPSGWRERIWQFSAFTSCIVTE